MRNFSFVQRTAAYVLIEILALVLLFHILVLAGVISYRLIGGGRLETYGDAVAFGLVSLVSNTVFLLIALRKIGKLKFIPNEKVVNGMLWAMAVVFLLNTFGNLMANNDFEATILAPMTLVLCACSVILALKK